MTPNFKTNLAKYSVKKFKSGEIQVTLDIDNKPIDAKNDLVITGSITSSDHLMELGQLVEVFRYYIPGGLKIILIMPYCAYSRQDRRCNIGESFSLKVFTNFLNSLNLDVVLTLDNHSAVSEALIEHNINYTLDEIFSAYSDIIPTDFFISPDAGANKKVQACSNEFKIPFIRADKTRDLSDNSISKTIIYTTSEQIKGKTLLILDDICDGGRTFAELAKAIKLIEPDCTINLFVTHGFFTYGINHLYEAGINTIYSTESVAHTHSIPQSDNFKVLPINLKFF